MKIERFPIEKKWAVLFLCIQTEEKKKREREREQGTYLNGQSWLRTAIDKLKEPWYELD